MRRREFLIAGCNLTAASASSPLTARQMTIVEPLIREFLAFSAPDVPDAVRSATLFFAEASSSVLEARSFAQPARNDRAGLEQNWRIPICAIAGSP